MQICITAGTGEGVTSVAAFDAALINAGIANYNLIYLSSVIPPGSLVRRSRFIAPADEYGHLLYVVVARHDENRAGHLACAGVGWTQERDNGRGLFVEIHGERRTEVEQDIQATLSSMISSRPFRYGEIESEVVAIECRDRPVCALAVAVYQSRGWK